MTRQLQEQENILITAATITSELSEVRKVAKEMSLGVMNAKAISHRAGDAARGFRPITDFIDEMAHEIMQLVIQISQEALTLSRLAVEHNHICNTKRRYEWVLKQADDTRHLRSLDPVLGRLSQEYEICRTQFVSKLRKLRDMLDDIKRSTRGAQVISATSRVEASRAMNFCKSLEVVADHVEQATEKIRQRINSSYNRIMDVMYVLANEDV